MNPTIYDLRQRLDASEEAHTAAVGAYEVAMASSRALQGKVYRLEAELATERLRVDHLIGEREELARTVSEQAAQLRALKGETF